MKKKLTIMFIPLILICLLLFIYRNSNDHDTSIDAKFNQIKTHNIKLKSVCKDKNLINYIKKNNNKELTNISDNQGGGNIVYYVAHFGKKKIGIYGKDNKSIKITKVVQYIPEKNIIKK